MDLEGLRGSRRAVEAEVGGVDAQGWKLPLGERVSPERRGEPLLWDEGRHPPVLFLLLPVVFSCTCTAEHTCRCSPGYLYPAVQPTEELIGCHRVCERETAQLLGLI